MEDRSKKGRTAGGRGRGVKGLKEVPDTSMRAVNAYSGSRNGQAKLDEDDVRLIRSVYADGTMTQRELAAEFGVHYSLIGFIVRRLYWKHVE